MLQQQAQPSSNDTLTKFLHLRTLLCVAKMLPVRVPFLVGRLFLPDVTRHANVVHPSRATFGIEPAAILLPAAGFLFTFARYISTAATTATDVDSAWEICEPAPNVFGADSQGKLASVCDVTRATANGLMVASTLKKPRAQCRSVQIRHPCGGLAIVEIWRRRSGNSRPNSVPDFAPPPGSDAVRTDHKLGVRWLVLPARLVQHVHLPEHKIRALAPRLPLRGFASYEIIQPPLPRPQRRK